MKTPRTTAAERSVRKQQKLEEIVNAAATRFAEQGLDATLHEIAGDLGMTGAALYYYVENKDQLLYEIWQRAGARLQKGLEEEISRPVSPLEKLRNAFRRHLQVIISNRPIFQVLIMQRSQMPQHGREEFIESERLYSSTLADLLQDVPRSQLKYDEPRLFANGLIAMLNGVIRWYSDEQRLKLDEIADLYFDLITQGLVAESKVD